MAPDVPHSPLRPDDHDALRDRAVARLQALVRIPTVSRQDPADEDASAFERFHEDLRAQFPRLHEELELTPVTPDEFDRLAEVRSLPWLLAALLGVLAIATMTSMLIVTVRRQRRDLAVLRAVGIAGGGVRRIVSVQALVVSAMGVVVGVPLGIVIGRVAWMSVARGLGAAAGPATSVPPPTAGTKTAASRRRGVRVIGSGVPSPC